MWVVDVDVDVWIWMFECVRICVRICVCVCVCAQSYVRRGWGRVQVRMYGGGPCSLSPGRLGRGDLAHQVLFALLA
jgi:hypothetical protein